MKRRVLVLVSFLAIAGAAVPVIAGDEKEGAELAKKGEGFSHGHGKVFGIKLTSEKLYHVLLGERVDPEKVHCASCKEAIKTHGVCKEHKIGAVNGRMYRSPFAYTLASGKPVDPEKVAKCSTCRQALKEKAFCKSCNVGYAANRVFEGREAHHDASAAYEMLMKAAELARECEVCGVARATSGNCPKHKNAYRYQKASPG